MTATPWNLLTEDSRFCNTTIIGYNPDTKKLEFEESVAHGMRLQNKCPLFDVNWALASYREYKRGKRVRLLVSFKYASSVILNFKYFCIDSNSVVLDKVEFEMYIKVLLAHDHF